MANSVIRACTMNEIEACQGLLAEYAAESRIDEIGIPDAQFATYRALEAGGVIHPIASFDGDAMTGFIIPLIVPLPHYGIVTATIESYFVAAACRRTGVGLRLLREAEHVSRKRGAGALLLSAPSGGKLAAVMAKLSNYRQCSQVFVRHL